MGTAGRTHTNLFTVALDDGVARAAAGARVVEQPWTEEVLQHVLVLNPGLLGVDDHLPLAIDGGSTSLGPDQLYVDEVGRLVIVEVKNERAGLKAMAQLISYSEHWRLLPLGELELCLLDMEARGSHDQVLEVALAELRSWAKAGALRRRPPRGSGARRKILPGVDRAGVRAFASAPRGEHGPSVPGAPARMVLIAPSFNADAIEFANALAARHVGINLIRAALHRDRAGGVLLSWEVLVAPHAEIEPTWAAARRLWCIPEFRARFALNAWADHLQTKSFSFSAREAPEAKIWLEVDAKELELYTCVPDGWCNGHAGERKLLRKRLLKRLAPCWSLGRWFGQSFRLPEPGDAFNTFALAMADAICDVLVPIASNDR
jgi:hypothetical protein